MMDDRRLDTVRAYDECMINRMILCVLFSVQEAWRSKSMKMARRGVIFGLLAVLAVLDQSDAQGAPPEARGLDLYFIDVQGGAATLLVTPERESVLIDSGWPGLEDRDPKRIVQSSRIVAGSTISTTWSRPTGTWTTSAAWPGWRS